MLDMVANVVDDRTCCRWQHMLEMVAHVVDISTCCRWKHMLQNVAQVVDGGILLKILAYVRDIDGLTLFFEFQCFTSQLLIGDENQFCG